MITDIVLKILKKDPFFKRNLLKSISWRIVGSIDTMFLGWLISGRLSIGAKIGLTELLTKLIIYYFHERLWQKIRFGLPSKRQQAKIVQNQITPTLFKQIGKISRRERERLNNNKSFTLWLTGLSGAGKSTLAAEIEEWIHHCDGRVYILDGDNTRLGINSDLTFSEEDRAENIRRVAEISRLFNEAGIIVVAAFISPFGDDRMRAKKIIGEDSFMEIYLEASVAVCQERDRNGLYKLAAQGKIKNFTGISSPYEPPVNPDLLLNTDHTSLENCLEIAKKAVIAKMGFVDKNHSVQYEYQ